jgi:hypothetical protein
MPPEPKAAATELRSLFLRYLAQKTPALRPDTLGLRLLAPMPTECVICNRPISVMLRARSMYPVYQTFAVASFDLHPRRDYLWATVQARRFEDNLCEEV